jgi:phosphate uptake regulator
MEVRKVMRLGMSSLVVSVPKEWADRYRLDGESRLVLIPQPDGSLALYPESVPRQKPRTITLTSSAKDPEGLLERRMVGAYLTDFDEIRIQSEPVISAEQRNRIRDYLRLFNGYQIMEASASQILIQKIAGVTEMDVERALHRAHTIARSMLDDAMKALQSRDSILAQTVIGLLEDINQFYYLINKQLRRALLDPNVMSRSGLTAIDAINYSMVLDAVRRTGQAAKVIGNGVNTLKNQDCPEDVLKLALDNGQLVLDLFTNAAKAFFTRDDILANDIVNKSKAVPPMRVQAEKLMERHLIQICERMIPNLKPESCALFGTRQVALTVLEQTFQELSQVATAAETIAQHAIWRAVEIHRPSEKLQPSEKKQGRQTGKKGRPKAGS